MNNILALAEKELRSYFASPIAYVIIGLFALLFGFFFDAYLTMFLRQSEQMMQMGGAPNINQNMIRGVLLNTAVIILFVMPMITMRTYAEEKSGRSSCPDLADHRSRDHRRRSWRASGSMPRCSWSR